MHRFNIPRGAADPHVETRRIIASFGAATCSICGRVSRALIRKRTGHDRRPRLGQVLQNQLDHRVDDVLLDLGERAIAVDRRPLPPSMRSIIVKAIDGIELERAEPVDRLQRQRVERRRVRQRHQELGVGELLHRDDADLGHRPQVGRQRRARGCARSGRAGSAASGAAPSRRGRAGGSCSGPTVPLAASPARVPPRWPVAAEQQRVDLVLREDLAHRRRLLCQAERRRAACVRRREIASERSCDTRDSPTPMTCADLRQRHLFLVVQRQDVPLAVRQLLDGPRQVLAQLRAARAARTGPRPGRCTARAAPAVLAGRRRAGGRRRAPASAAARATCRSRRPTAHRGGDLFLRRLAAAAVAQPAPSRRRLAAQLAQRARRPVELAQRVEHRALDAAAREGVERHAERRLDSGRPRRSVRARRR